MGIKENVNAIKEELSTEEQFLESVIKAEGFFKKYKILIIATIAAVIIAAIAYSVYQSMKHNNLVSANEAYNTLMQDPSDTTAISTLQSKNPNLYMLFLFGQEMKKGENADMASLQNVIKDPLLTDMMTYQQATLTQKGLASYTEGQDALLKEFAVIEEAYLLTQADKKEEAKNLLSQIGEDSPLRPLAQSFLNYLN